MPAGHETFEARIRRIQAGKQIIGEGLDQGIGARRRAQGKAKSRGGRGLLAVLVVCGGFGGAYASGQLPEQMNTQILAWGAQAQDSVLAVMAPARDAAAEMVDLPQG